MYLTSSCEMSHFHCSAIQIYQARYPSPFMHRPIAINTEEIQIAHEQDSIRKFSKRKTQYLVQN